MASTEPADGAEEATLIAQACAGGTAAFARLARRYEAPLARFCYRLIGRVDLADDLQQETLLRAFVSLPQLHDPERFGAWLFGIAANLAKWWWRRQARWPVSLEALAAEYPDVGWERILPDRLQPEQIVEEADQTRRLQEAIAALPADLARPLVLHYLDGLSYAEVADALAVPLSTVKGRLFKSRSRLRQTLGIDFRPVSGERLTKPRRQRRKKGQTSVVPVDSQLIRVIVDRINLPLEEPAVEVVLRHFEQATRKRTREDNPDLTSVAEQVAPILVRAGVRLRATNRQIVLRAVDSSRELFIIVGEAEAVALAVHQQGQTLPRPLSYDLMKALVDAGGLLLTQITVLRLEDTTFYAAITVQQPGGGTLEVDARPSDAINLAVRTGAPIFVAEQLWQQASITLNT
jgi:RNA polymerase sigma factor (sigma-70 family)